MFNFFKRFCNIDFMFKRPDFLDISDAEAIKNDWYTIGSDIREAIDCRKDLIENG